MNTMVVLLFMFAIGINSISLGYTDWTKESIIDLTHDFDENAIYWPGGGNFELKPIFKGKQDDYWAEFNRFSAPEHGGTHLDAPSHFAEKKWAVGDIPIKNFIAPAIVINISSTASRDPDAQVQLQDLVNWEKKYGKIPDGAVVFMYSGWGKRWPNRESYYGSATYNDTSTLHFPSVHPQAAKWLVSQRSIVGLGVDTASVDPGSTKNFMTHRIVCAANVYNIENVANLHMLPPVGATVIVLPMKIRHGSGAPCRVIALPGNKSSSVTQAPVSNNIMDEL